VIFTGARLAEVREVWIGHGVFVGRASVSASVTVGGDKHISIPDCRRAPSTRAIIRVRLGTRRAPTCGLRVRGSMAAFRPKETKGLRVVSLMRAVLRRGRARVFRRRPAEYYLRHVPGTTRERGDAAFHPPHLRQRPCGPGRARRSRAAGPPRDVAGFVVEGSARARLDVVPADPGAQAPPRRGLRHLPLLARACRAEPVMEGRGFGSRTTAPASLATLSPADLSLGSRSAARSSHTRVSLNEFLPEARRPDQGWDGARRGRLRCGGGRGLLPRSMTVRGDGLAIDADGVDTTGSFSSGPDPRGNLPAAGLRCGRTRLDLDRLPLRLRLSQGVRVIRRGGAPRLERQPRIPRADLDISAALAVKGRLERRASDSRPLAAFISPRSH